jgi:hypothetical protein
MLEIFAYQVPKIYQTETPFGVPLGFLLLIAIIIRYLTINFGSSSTTVQKPVPPPPAYQPLPLSEKECRMARESLTNIIVNTANRTGYTQDQIATLIQKDTGIVFTMMPDGTLNISEPALRKIRPRLWGLKMDCQDIRRKPTERNWLKE